MYQNKDKFGLRAFDYYGAFARFVVHYYPMNIKEMWMDRKRNLDKSIISPFSGAEAEDIEFKSMIRFDVVPLGVDEIIKKRLRL